MCHRFELYQTPKVIKLLEGTGYSVKEPRIFNPGDIAPVLAMDRNLKPRVFFMKWGYSIYDKLVYNSRSEDIVNRRSFSNDYMKHRCVIPATSYYEWDKKKSCYHLLPNHELIYFAGIYRLENSKAVFSIITLESDADLKTVHDRMPMVISDKEVTKYINPSTPISQIPKYDCELKIDIIPEEERLF